MPTACFVIDGDEFVEVGFIPTGPGTHGLYPSRDGTKLYVANRGSHKVYGPPRGKGSVSVIDFATRKVVATWPIPGGGSPDMGNVSADGKMLWLSGRFDDVVYAIDTTTGEVRSIKVGKEPHGLDGVAAARPLLARPHRQPALGGRARRRASCSPRRPFRWPGAAGAGSLRARLEPTAAWPGTRPSTRTPRGIRTRTVAITAITIRARLPTASAACSGCSSSPAGSCSSKRWAAGSPARSR